MAESVGLCDMGYNASKGKGYIEANNEPLSLQKDADSLRHSA